MKKYKEKNNKNVFTPYTEYTSSENYDLDVIYTEKQFDKLDIDVSMKYLEILEQAVKQAEKFGYKKGTLVYLKSRNNILGKIKEIYDDPDVAFCSPKAFKSRVPEIFDVEFITNGNTTRMELFSLKDIYLAETK